MGRRAELLGPASARAPGSALVLALWIALLLGVGGLAAMRLAASGAGTALVEVDLARARAAAEGGIWAAAHRLAATADRPPRLALDFALGAARVSTIALDEDGRVDLNAAELPALVALFRTAGSPSTTEATALATRLRRYREEATRAPEAPRGPVFRTVEELQRVPGIPPALAAAAAPFATVHTGRAAPAVEAAPAPLAPMLDGGGRGEGGAAPTGTYRTPSRLRDATGRRIIWRIESEAVVGAVRARMAAVMALRPGGALPGQVLEWHPVAAPRRRRGPMRARAIAGRAIRRWGAPRRA